MKYAADRPFADPEKAARRSWRSPTPSNLIQDGRIHPEKINGPFLYVDRAKVFQVSLRLIKAGQPRPTSHTLGLS
jgi:hypothetical protein